MFRTSRVPLLAAAFALSLPVLAAEADDAKGLTSQISEVTVYADRARVTRVGSVDLGETKTVAFRKLPGWIDEGSVRLTLVPSDAGQILDVEVERNHLAEPEEVGVRKAETALRDVTDQIAALDDEKAVLDAQAKQIDAIRVFSLDKLPKDATVREVKSTEFSTVVDYVTDALRKNAKARRDIEQKRRDLIPQQAVKARELGELRERAQLEQRTVNVTLKGTKRAKLMLTYMLPGATWEPTHELRAGSDGGPVQMASYASVTQTTGEDWEGATLTFSTQRPNETMKLPEVEALMLGGGTLARAMNPGADSFSSALQTYSSQNAVFGKSRADYASNFAQQQEVQTRIEAVFSELQERGTTAHFSAVGSPTIRADGKTVRVPIGAASLSAAHRILAAPEVSLNAAHTLDLVNTGDQPLLPGKVALYLDGAFLGTTEAEFVAPGEKFSTFAGVDDRIKLARTLDKKHSGLERGKRTKITVSWIVSAENLGNSAVNLQLADRVPVSENDDIKVSNVRVTPDGKPDAKGLLKWDVPLAAKQKKQFRVEYTLEYPTDLLTRYRTNRAANPSPAAKERVFEDIDQLEIMTK